LRRFLTEKKVLQCQLFGQYQLCTGSSCFKIVAQYCLPTNTKRCDSQFLLLHNYCHRPQAHTRCPTTTTLLYIPEKSYMGPESVCREFSVTNHGCICIKLLFAWTPITAPVIHTFATAKSLVQNYSCNGLDCLGLVRNLSPSSMYLQGQNYCMVLMLISTLLLPSCTPQNPNTICDKTLAH
jgi:hypothetical protein